MIDLDFVRQRFHQPESPWVFAENAGGSYPLKAVTSRVAEYMANHPAQLGATHELSRRAGELVATATSDLARMINAESAELVIGPSSSSLTARIARAMAPGINPGDQIIVTDADHEANITPWLRLRQAGAEIVWWHLNPETASLDVADLEMVVTEKTRLIACTHASNVFGQVVDIPAVVNLARSVGAKTFVDGVAYAPHRSVDVKALGVDFYAISLYKLFGPHIGMLAATGDNIAELPNINLEHLPADTGAYKLQPGGVCYELIHGAGAIPAYLNDLHSHGSQPAWAQIQAHESDLTRHLIDGLKGVRGLRIIGKEHSDQRLPIIAFAIEGKTPAEIARLFDEADIATKMGHFHAPRLIKAIGHDVGTGLNRVSLAHYNSVEDVGRLVNVLHSAD